MSNPSTRPYKVGIFAQTIESLTDPLAWIRSFSRANATEAKWALPGWYQKILWALIIEVFFLIALGGFVRHMDAGLACPDWPLCFGDFIPDYHPQVFLEFIHRALAGVVAVITLGLVGIMTFKSKAPKNVKKLAIFAAFLLLAQVVAGALTVVLQLHAKIVATHLGLAAAFFLCLNWIYLCVNEQGHAQSIGQISASPTNRLAHKLSIGFLVLVFGQILLGGSVASHNASLVCLDFPTCQGKMFPTFSGPVGLQVLHRLVAYLVVLSAIVVFVVSQRLRVADEILKYQKWILYLVGVQIAVGIANIWFYVPPLIGVIHLATAMLILSLALRPTFKLSKSSEF